MFDVKVCTLSYSLFLLCKILGCFIFLPPSILYTHDQEHNVIHLYNNVMWDWQYYMKYSSHSYFVGNTIGGFTYLIESENGRWTSICVNTIVVVQVASSLQWSRTTYSWSWPHQESIGAKNSIRFGLILVLSFCGWLKQRSTFSGF